MLAHVGDRICIFGRVVGVAVRTGTITEVRGAGGEPPYVVRWDGAQTTVLMFPGADAHVSQGRPPVAEHG